GGRARAECREYDQRHDCESSEPQLGYSGHRNRFDHDSSLYEGRRNRTVLEYRILARCRPDSKNRRLVACRNPQLAKRRPRLENDVSSPMPYGVFNAQRTFPPSVSDSRSLATGGLAT